MEVHCALVYRLNLIFLIKYGNGNTFMDLPAHGSKVLLEDLHSELDLAYLSIMSISRMLIHGIVNFLSSSQLIHSML